MAIEVEVFDERICDLGEGPFDDNLRKRAVWLDILSGKVLYKTWDGLEAGEFSVGEHIGALVPASSGKYIACMVEGPAEMDEKGNWKLITKYKDNDAKFSALATRSNDAKCDPFGDLWLGTMTYEMQEDEAALYRLRARANKTERLHAATISNGLGWSPNRDLMYYIDTFKYRVDIFDVDANGDPQNRRTFADIPQEDGFPDGMCVDAEGGIWVALWGGGQVRRYEPNGNLSEIVKVPGKQSTSCAFVGPDLDLMIITTAQRGSPTTEITDDSPGAGKTYAIKPGVKGMPTDKYRD